LAVVGIQGLQKMAWDIPSPVPDNAFTEFWDEKICSGFYMMVTSCHTAYEYMMIRSWHTGTGILEPGNPMKR